MTRIELDGYDLLLSYDCCDIFEYYQQDNFHGLNYHECIVSNNTSENSYIAGWANFVPKINGDYNDDDKRYIFINLSRCRNDISTILLIHHEVLHHSLFKHNYNLHKEEEIISWADVEALKIFEIVKNELQANNSIKKD